MFTVVAVTSLDDWSFGQEVMVGDECHPVAPQVIRAYHGHLSGVYSLALHPTLDVLMTGGRDSVCRVWDMRTKLQVHCLSGHTQTVCSILAQPTDPQVCAYRSLARKVYIYTPVLLKLIIQFGTFSGQLEVCSRNKVNQK